MENNQNNAPQKKNYTAIIIVIIVVAILFLGLVVTGGILVYKNIIVPKTTDIIKEKTNSNSKGSSGSTTKKQSNVSSKDAKESKIDSPLEIGEWGLASKYAGKYLSEKYADKNYIDVPVRVTKVVRGDKAKEEVKDWVANSKYYKYTEPKAYLEWAVIDYEVDLSDVSFDEGTIGTSIKIDSGVKSPEGGSVKYNGITYILTTTDASSSDYVKEPGVYEGKFIVQLPEGCKDYVIKLGNSYNGAESYFKGE